jgi:hypothetical protein
MEATVIGNGVNSNVELQVDPSFLAARTSIRPLEYNVNGILGGHYSIGAQTGTMAAGIASAAQVFQVRWADSTKLFILKKLTVQCATLTGFAATSLGAPLELIIGHGSTANGSGGTALAPTSTSNRLRQVMQTTAFATSGEIRIATTAALTAATGQTLEPAAISECMGAANATLIQSPVMNLFEQRDFGIHPLILNSGDTLAVRTLNPAATGTWVACFSMSWAEAIAY